MEIQYFVIKLIFQLIVDNIFCPLKYRYCNQTFNKKMDYVDNFFDAHKKYFKKNKKVTLSVRKNVLPLQSKFCKCKLE